MQGPCARLQTSAHTYSSSCLSPLLLLSVYCSHPTNLPSTRLSNKPFVSYLSKPLQWVNKERQNSNPSPLTNRMISLFGKLSNAGDSNRETYRERLFTCGSSNGDDCSYGNKGEDTVSSSQGPRLGFLGALLEPICPRPPLDPDGALFNEDFAPTMPQERTFTIWDMTCLWIGLVVGVPTYYMAGSLVEMGMAWWQGILTVLFANLVILIPIVLSGHAGTKYGVPFPVLARASFGIRGANVPSLLRALVGCGWFGIQTWIGGQAIYQLVNTLANGSLQGGQISWLGTSAPEFGCFMIFWLLQVYILSENIKYKNQNRSVLLCNVDARLSCSQTSGTLGLFKLNDERRGSS